MSAQVFTPAEAAALTELTEKQVRKELEYKVIASEVPPRLSFAALVYLFLVRRSQLRIPVEVRTRLYQKIDELLAEHGVLEDLEVAEPFYLRVGDQLDDLSEKVNDFFAWKASLGSDPDVMGGSVVFPESRLTVRHVGGMLERGVDPEEILEDYPYLGEQDLRFARLFVRAYPQVGRPGGRG